jgi:hypothetical protein
MMMRRRKEKYLPNNAVGSFSQPLDYFILSLDVLINVLICPTLSHSLSLGFKKKKSFGLKIIQIKKIIQISSMTRK